ncbi:MAG TPA: PadR family transcriptional regulator [Nitrososphaerales archaeon]|nr:PadR family transcriptional regulator [Nitrososphaerales archaeon]
MISAPKGLLRLATLRLLSESSMSGTALAEHIARVSEGEWKPGPGSIYLILGELLRQGLITELPKRGGNLRRYVISSRGKDELSKLSREASNGVGRQLRLLAVYSALSGRTDIQKALLSASNDIKP